MLPNLLTLYVLRMKMFATISYAKKNLVEICFMKDGGFRCISAIVCKRSINRRCKRGFCFIGLFFAKFTCWEIFLSGFLSFR